MSNDKIPYVCGPLTELPEDEKKKAKRFYERIADLCQEVTGKRAFVPHEHYDPVEHADFSPLEVDKAERFQVCEQTSCLIVAAIAPSWGGGIEVEMANQSKIPVVLLFQKNKSISRLLRGNPSIFMIIAYEYDDEALSKLKVGLRRLVS